MNERTPAQLKALEAARQKRAIASERKAPEGYRSVEHFLDDVHEYCQAKMRIGGANQYSPAKELAAYLKVNESSVRKWLKREKIPLQPTIDAIAQWLRTKKAGL